MAIKKSRAHSLRLPAKQWLSRAGVVMLATVAAALLMMSKAGNPAVGKLRTGITDLATPILAVTSRPLDAWYSLQAWVSEISHLRSENIALKNQNLQLMQWQAAAKDMESENRSLRELLSVVPSHKNSYVTARIVSDLGGPYVRSALINGGSESGIKKDEAAINESGLLGRVVDVGANSARLLLLSDINSRVPVIGERTHERGILAGNNSDQPVLSYLAAGSKIEIGERMVTSGDGGIFPPGIPVGIVTASEAGTVKIQPFADPASAEYVSVIDSDF